MFYDFFPVAVCVCAVLWKAAHVLLIPFFLLEINPPWNHTSCRQFLSDVANLPLSYMLLAVPGLAATGRNCCPGLKRVNLGTLGLWVNSGWDFPKILYFSWAQRTVDRLIPTVERRACWLDGGSYVTVWARSSTVKSEKKPMIQMTVCTPLCMLH